MAVFWGSSPNLVTAVNKLNRQSSLFETALRGLGGFISDVGKQIGDVIAGGGSVAPDANVEKAVQWCIDKANSNSVVYVFGSPDRFNPDGLYYDCSGFLCTAFDYAGFDIQGAGGTYTGNMIPAFTSRGWKWIEGSTWSADELQRGDILLNIEWHTQMYIGNNQDVNCGYTPASIESHCQFYEPYGWDGILRYDG